MSPTRRPLVRALALAAAAVLAPTAVLAQAAAPATGEQHVVRRGDTLWALSARCLGDPFRWPELHRANLAVVENPHLIYPGELLNMPCEAVRAAVAAAAERTPEPAIVGGVEVVPSTVVAPASTPEAPVAQSGLDARRQLDFLSAPWAAPAELPAQAGRLHAIPERVGTRARDGRRFQLADDVRVELPEGNDVDPGTRYLVVRRVARLADGVGLFKPSGIVELRGHEGAFVHGRVVAVFGAMEPGDRLLPVPAIGPESAGGATGGRTRVAWVEDGALLPSIQDWIVLEPGEGARLEEGDRVELLHRVSDERGAALADEVVATARVVRITPMGASALITSVRKPLVQVGTAGRVVPAGS